jgi:urea carboxylase-associated protein 1
MLGQQLPPGEIIGDEILPARAYWHRRLDKGTVLRIVDLEGCQSVDTLIYDAADTAVRYNAANTMKLARSVYLSKGCIVYDDLAQPLMTMIEDTVGRHDTLAGNCSREINLVRYGKPGSLSCRDNFIKALGELGMGPRDIPANIDFFMNVPVNGKGDVAIADGISKPGDYVDLRSEKDVIVVISNCPQEFNPCSGGHFIGTDIAGRGRGIAKPPASFLERYLTPIPPPFPQRRRRAGHRSDGGEGAHIHDGDKGRSPLAHSVLLSSGRQWRTGQHNVDLAREVSPCKAFHGTTV